MIRIYEQREYQLRKVKVIKSIFCRIRCEFSKFNTSQPAPSSSTFAQWNLQKIHMFPKDFHYFLFYQIVVLHQICYCLPGIYCSNQDPLLQYVRDLQNIFLPELVNSVHQIFSEHLTTRNCCSVPSDIFRTSYYQKYYFRPSDIVVLQYVTLFPKIINHYYLVISVDIFNHGFATGYLGNIIQFPLLWTVFCSLFHDLCL